jgi:hypothetical protein
VVVATFPAGLVKCAFDAKVKIAPWAFHDLRRTAKSLMARAGVLPHNSERVLGHAIGGVEAPMIATHILMKRPTP